MHSDRSPRLPARLGSWRRYGGPALVSWASGVDPSTQAPSGVFAAVSDASGFFGAPQLLADARTATLPQPTGAAIAATWALVAWAGPQGAQVARAVTG